MSLASGKFFLFGTKISVFSFSNFESYEDEVTMFDTRKLLLLAI